jgi:hypothetical protein
MQIYAVIMSTKLVMKLKLVSLESGSSLSNDAISVSIRCIVWKIFAFKTTLLKNDTFQPDENELIKHIIKRYTVYVNKILILQQGLELQKNYSIYCDVFSVLIFNNPLSCNACAMQMYPTKAT